MKNNLSVAIQVLNPEISVASVSRAQEKFYPSLSFSFNKRNTDSASYSFLDARRASSTSLMITPSSSTRRSPGAARWACP